MSLRGVRARSALAAAAVIGAALAVGAVALVLGIQRALLQQVDAAALGRAHEVAARLHSDGPAAVGRSLAGLPSAGPQLQLLDPAGAVLAASPGLTGAPALLPARAADGAVTSATRDRLPAAPGSYRVVELGVGYPGRDLAVVVAEPLRPVQGTVRMLALALTAGTLLLAGVAGAATWWLVGRALDPVEGIRRQVARISARQLAERVPVPATGDEVARLAATMNAMLARLQAAQAAQRRFTADASHELKSPLATVRAGLDILAGHPALAGQLLPDLRAETERLGRLVDDLLLLAGADEGGLALDRRPVDVSELVDAEARRLAAATDRTVTTQLTAATVVGDRHRLAQLIRNLADNAARHAAGAVRLTVRIEADPAGGGDWADPAGGGDWAVLEVADDGPGIPAADRGRVFDRFVRLTAARERSAGGSGLGLAIVAEVAAAHGGRVEVLDAVGGGALLRVRLPAGLPPADWAGQPPPEVPGLSPPEVPGQPPSSAST